MEHSDRNLVSNLCLSCDELITDESLIATGTICRLHRCGYQVLVLETEYPTAIHRTVSFCEAIYDGTTTVEDVTAVRVQAPHDCHGIWQQNKVPITPCSC